MDFSELGTDCQLTDLVITVNAQEFPVHRLVLSMKCDYFKEKEKSGKPSENTMSFDSFPGGAENFADILDFCYNRNIQILPKNIAQLRCGAEELKMRGEENLISVTEERFDESMKMAQRLTSAVLPFEVLNHCSDFPELADTTRLVDRCIDVITCIWSNPNFRCDVAWAKVANLPFPWFMRLLRGCCSKKSNYLLLAEIVFRYTFQVLSPNTPGNKTNKKPSGEKRQSTAGENSRQKVETPSPHEALEEIIATIPFRTPLASVITPDWLNRCLDVIEQSDSQKYKQKFLQICSAVLRCKCSRAYRVLGAERITVLVKSHKSLNDLECRKLAEFIDEYVKDACDMKQMTIEQYLQLVKAAPRGCKLQSDAHLLAFESLCDSGQEPTEEQKKEFLRLIDLQECCDRHIKRVLQKEILPADVVCKAMLLNTDECENGDMIGAFSKYKQMPEERSLINDKYNTFNKKPYISKATTPVASSTFVSCPLRSDEPERDHSRGTTSKWTGSSNVKKYSGTDELSKYDYSDDILQSKVGSKTYDYGGYDKDFESSKPIYYNQKYKTINMKWADKTSCPTSSKYCSIPNSCSFIERAKRCNKTNCCLCERKTENEMRYPR